MFKKSTILLMLLVFIFSVNSVSAQVLAPSQTYPKSQYGAEGDYPLVLDDTPGLAVQYEYTELSPDCNMAKDYATILLIGSQLSLYEDCFNYQIRKTSFSYKRNLTFGEAMSLNQGHNLYDFTIAKKTNSDKFEVFWSCSLLMKYNDEAKQDWKFEDDEPMEFCGYACHKATTTFRGRTWTVWYADDLPVDAGPWKLHGLPGLIMYAQSDDALHTFKATTLEIDNNLPICIDKSMIDNYERCSLEKGIALFNEYRTNSPAFELKYPGVYVSEDMQRLNEQLAKEHKDFEKCYHPIEVLQ